MNENGHVTRRGFLKVSSVCAAHMALMASPFPLAARSLWANRTRGQIIAQEPFGRIESVGEGLWAFISTPLGGDYTTVSNGGIIAGSQGVLVVEAFQTPEGAHWIAEQARTLTGRWPTHVLITHYHSDHSQGVGGYFQSIQLPGSLATDLVTPSLHVTQATRNLIADGLPPEAPATLRERWADVVLIPGEAPSTLDLGNRQVRLIPREGHSPSDVTVELPEDGTTWCGDLVWNGMFPNYMDAVPSRLSTAVRSIQGEARKVYVPGHGPLADSADMNRYVAVINGLEETARAARREGWTAEEAGERHQIPESLGEWTLFNPSYFQRAVEAWMKEWQGEIPPGTHGTI
jgi:glyoxylase-like metal-dependent hydrolase (beta-lactamase superfamily II)